MEQPKVADRIYTDLSKFYKIKNTPEEFKQKLYSDEKVRAKVFSDLQRHYNVKNDFNSFNESILKEATPEPSFFNKLREQSGFNKFMAEQNEALNTAQQQMGQAQVNVGGIQGVKKFIETPIIPFTKLAPPPLTEEEKKLMPKSAQDLYSVVKGGVDALGIFSEGLTAPQNLALMVGLGGVGGLAGRLISGVFSYEMFKEEPELVAGFIQAVKNGNKEEVTKYATLVGLTGAFAGATARHALKGRTKMDASATKTILGPDFQKLVEDAVAGTKMEGQVKEGVKKLVTPMAQAVPEPITNVFVEKWKANRKAYDEKERLAKVGLETDDLQQWAQRYNDYYDETVVRGIRERREDDPLKDISDQVARLSDKERITKEFRGYFKEKGDQPVELKTPIIIGHDIPLEHVDKIKTAIKFLERFYPDLIKPISRFVVLNPEEMELQYPGAHAYFNDVWKLKSETVKEYQEWAKSPFSEMAEELFHPKSKEFALWRDRLFGEATKSGEVYVRSPISPKGRTYTTDNYVNSIAHEFLHNKDFNELLWRDWNKLFEGDYNASPEFGGQVGEWRARTMGYTSQYKYKKLRKTGVSVWEGTEKVIKGLAEFLKVDPNSLTSGIMPFTEEGYKRGLVHFKSAFQDYRKAGKEFGEFAKDMETTFGPDIRAYMARLKVDIDSGVIPPVEVTKALEGDRSSPIREPGSEDLKAVSGGVQTEPLIKYKDILPFQDWIESPEFLVVGDPNKPKSGFSEISRDLTSMVIDADQLRLWEAAKADEFFKKMKSLLRKPPKGRKASRNEFRNRQLAVSEMLDTIQHGDAGEKIEMQRRHPEVFEVAAKIDEWFKWIRNDVVKPHLRNMVRLELDPNLTKAFDESIAEPRVPLKLIADANGVKLKDLKEWVDKYNAVDKWGYEDYITHIELGNWYVNRYEMNTETGELEAHHLAVGTTKKSAINKATQIKKEQPGVGELKIESSFARTNPLEPRKGILKGEANIFDALPLYAHKIFTAVRIGEVEAKFKKAVKEVPNELPPNIRMMIRRMISSARGMYSVADRVANSLISRAAEAYGVEWKELTPQQKVMRRTGVESIAAGMKASPVRRMVARERQFVAHVKLGFRLVAGFINYVGSSWRTEIKRHGLSPMTEAAGHLKTEAGKKLIVQEEPFLGGGYVSGAAGKPILYAKKFSSLWWFSAGEPSVRRISYTAAYLHGIKNMGLSEAQARMFARRSNRFQSMVYNLASLPVILRTQPGRVFGQFSSYVGQEIQFISTLTPRQAASYIGMHLTLGGPRGLMLMAKAVPFLGALGVIDKVEEWINKQNFKIPIIDKIGTWTAGIFGLLGGEASAAATFQIPTLGGAIISDLTKLYKTVINPLVQGIEPTLIKRDVVEWMRHIPVAFKYWTDAIEAGFDKDGWVYDWNTQTKLYRVNDVWDIALLIAGVGLLPHAERRSAMNILNKSRTKRIEGSKRVYRELAASLRQANQSPLNYLMKQRQERLVDLAIQYGLVDVQSIEEKVKRAMLDPDERIILEQQMIEKIKAMELLEGLPK